jgi:lipid II:glycine glycyltransferase (peptidoglycan interpeptide bridge formation enzyme)
MNIVDRAKAIIEPLGSMINLVTFDVVDIKKAHVETSADPLMVILNYPMLDEINSKLHPYLRKAIKDYVKTKNFYAGQITLWPTLTIKLYAERRITPAWEPD